MNFKKRRLNKALEEKVYRVKLVHGKFIGWVPVITNMDKPAQEYIDAGATTWF